MKIYYREAPSASSGSSYEELERKKWRTTANKASEAMKTTKVEETKKPATKATEAKAAKTTESSSEKKAPSQKLANSAQVIEESVNSLSENPNPSVDDIKKVDDTFKQTQALVEQSWDPEIQQRFSQDVKEVQQKSAGSMNLLQSIIVMVQSFISNFFSQFKKAKDAVGDVVENVVDTGASYVTKEATTNNSNSESIDIDNLPPWDKWLLDYIGQCEWTGNNYDAFYGYRNWKKWVKLTEMTLWEVQAFQRKLRSGKINPKLKWSSAAWKYQFMHDTLRDLIKQEWYSLNRKFDKDFQDEIAMKTLNQSCWLKEFKKTKNIWKFQFNLSKIWASIAKDDSWLSYHEGDKMKNHASEAGKKIKQALNRLYINT